ncbi:MAG: hypothetical protein IKA12_00135 [Clostridia bacterium]|nr:hypothetical protein [Clostridia bacterium]
MKKGKSITLLSIIGVIMALLIFITFARFPVGINNFNSVLGAINTDYDISGGTAYTVKLADDNVENVDNIEDVISTVSKRLEALGYSSYSVKALRPEAGDNDTYELRIEAKASLNKYGEPDYTSLDADVATATEYGSLQFFGNVEVDPTNEHEILEGVEVIKSAKYQLIGGDHVVEITFTDEAYNTIKENMGDASYYLKITLGGEALAPFDGSTNSAITANSFAKSMYLTAADEASARQMVLKITSGGLEYKYDAPVRIENVTSPYGTNVELVCALAVAIVFVLSLVALVLVFKGFGIISALSMILFMLLEVAMLIAVPGIKLGLGGVVGIIFATVLALDGFIITAKRIKEESKLGKTVKASVKNGFKRSLVPVLNCGVISAIVSLLLFSLTRGAVNNFAITFGIGTVIAVISTLLFARMFTSLLLGVVKNKEAFLGVNKVEE